MSRHLKMRSGSGNSKFTCSVQATPSGQSRLVCSVSNDQDQSQQRSAVRSAVKLGFRPRAEANNMAKIQILFMQDFEGRLFQQVMQTAYATAGLASGVLQASDAGRPDGGLATIKTYFDAERARNKDTLFLLGAEVFTSSNRTAQRVTNSYFFYEPTKCALKLLGLNGRGLGPHDFMDEDLQGGPNKFGVEPLTNVVAAGINDPLSELVGLQNYLMFTVQGVKIAYICVPDNRISANSQAPLCNPAYPMSRLFWGNGGINVPTNLLTLIAAANTARNQAAAAGAQVFIFQIHRGFGSGGTGNTVLANAVGFDIFFFDNFAQTLAGWRTDGQGRKVFVAEPWSQGEEYARFTIVYDKVNNVIDHLEGKADTVILQTSSDNTVMQQVMVPVFADVVYGDPKMQKLLNNYDCKAHKDLDVKVATLTRNLTLTASNVGTAVPNDDRAIFLNMMADALAWNAGTTIALVSRFVTGFSPSPPLNASRQLIQYFQPRISHFSRLTAPFDLLKGDLWDSIYNEVGTNYAGISTAMTVNDLFATLEQSVRFLLTANDVSAIVGISGFTYTYKASNALGSRVRTVTIGSTTYTRQPDNSVPNGTDVISGVADGFTLLTQALVAGTPDYPLINTSTWNPAPGGYGYVVDSMIDYLEALGTFDPNNAYYINRFASI